MVEQSQVPQDEGIENKGEMIEGLDILATWLMFVINIKYVWGRCGRNCDA